MIERGVHNQSMKNTKNVNLYKMRQKSEDEDKETEGNVHKRFGKHSAIKNRNL